jgi:hypothetical protein
VDHVTTMKVVLQAPVSGGVPPLPVKADADLCSGPCIAAYILREDKLLKDLKQHVGRIAAVGAMRRPVDDLPPTRILPETAHVVDDEDDGGRS